MGGNVTYQYGIWNMKLLYLRLFEMCYVVLKN